MTTLAVRDLHVAVHSDDEHKEILRGVNLTIRSGEVHAIMGPNGTGKSTLSETIMGNPNYEVRSGDITLDGTSILDWSVDQRARAGLFLAMQYPPAIAGITNAEFIRAAVNSRRGDDDQVPVVQFLQDLDANLAKLKMPEDMADRYLNAGFSGGEKKKNEILQLLMIKPALAILDEIDSGLDIDALRIVAAGVNSMRSANFASLIITHYQRLLNYIVPDVVHVMKDGRIIESGGPELAKSLEHTGYEQLSEADNG
ncbi:Fe-S cluster assembly ATPase SufC [Lacticaseibacillus thailandensis]|uniref:Fe-S cluster assembly ABC-type transport system, ATPase component n=1 Tax=Lacticaseibacillus thailandensis DSM 22698 = JCM 13996 TaxID=1423810 RepID=A0A0R2C5E1_9LACO|nr:Fe-S cluster assembly ATPase SufC [Lacticaseibacillus thailandensis]KRM86977.1 Fe-S cluster assembly ABC-type transport system, ATPase component [Lacticaseibacillus thailandensis DSM 22698 = JCM 13996]